jgi:hypothetical protein
VYWNRCDITLFLTIGLSLILPDQSKEQFKRRQKKAQTSAVDSKVRTIWIVDAHRDGKRFIVHADEKLTAFLELESTIR